LAPKRFKFAPRQPVASFSDVSAGPDNELRVYLSDLESLTEDTGWEKNLNINALGGLALDLVAAPASQAYVERLFSVCGDLTARKQNKTKQSLEQRVFLKLNCSMLAKLPKVWPALNS